MRASESGRREVIKLLLAAGADVHAQREVGCLFFFSFNWSTFQCCSPLVCYLDETFFYNHVIHG